MDIYFLGGLTPLIASGDFSAQCFTTDICSQLARIPEWCEGVQNQGFSNSSPAKIDNDHKCGVSRIAKGSYLFARFDLQTF